MPRNDSSHIITIGIVVNGFTLGDAVAMDIPSDRTVNDVRIFLKRMIPSHPDPKHSNLNVEKFHLWRVLVPRPPYFNDRERFYKDVLTLSEIDVKCKLLDDNHEVGDVLNEDSYPEWLMFAVVEFFD
ncbi:MAG: hypothetical protein J3R72DRAFT_490533 [Linnemannia gamsii]|nr:MAG: hypothetical protein J3R72DRAFT_490533 [Linnemannia gamsii]